MVHELVQGAAPVRYAVLGVRVHLGVGLAEAGGEEDGVPAKVPLAPRRHNTALCPTLEYLHLLALTLK